MLYALTDSPTFYPTTVSSPSFLSYADLNTLRDNAVILDAESRRGRDAFHSYNRLMADYGYFEPLRIWWGSFQMRGGLTTAVFVFDTVKVGSESYTIQFNGSTVGTGTLANGVSTVTVALGALGYIEYQIVKVEVLISGAGERFDGAFYAVRDAYVEPLSAIMTWAWPGVPTFGNITHTNLNQLSNACDWLGERLTLAAQPIFRQTKFYTPSANGGGVYYDESPPRAPLWSGSISRDNGTNRLYALIDVTTQSRAETLRLSVNGSVVATQALSANSAYSITFAYDTSGLTDEVIVPITLDSLITSDGDLITRYHVRAIGSGYQTLSAATPPDESEILESLTFGNLQTRLNAIATIVSSAKSRMDSAPDHFNRVRMFTRRSVPDDAMDAGMLNTQLVAGTVRTGAAIWVRGKGVKAGYGALTIKPPDPQDPNGTVEYSYQYEEDIIGGDKDATVLVYLDSLPGLYVGDSFVLLGDVYGAFQYGR